MAQEVTRLSDTHLYDSLVHELGDPLKILLEAKRITHSRKTDDALGRPAVPKKKV